MTQPIQLVIDHDWDRPVAATDTGAPEQRRWSRSKVPTHYTVQYKGRQRRVYSTNYGFNSERAYILYRGRELKVETYEETPR